MRRLTWMRTALALLLATGGAALARAQSPSTLQMTGVRTWSAPVHTRVVIDLEAPVAPVAPDSGSAPELVVALPYPGLVAAPGLAPAFSVRDSAVDSVWVTFDAAGARVRLTMAPGTRFSVFTLPAADDMPFRVVIDVTRIAAAAAENQRLAELARNKKRDRIRIVAIDAGHGGEDVGARGSGPTYEKNITLSIAKKLAAELARIPGVQPLLTREGDYFIPLRERYRIAERAKADLFISIHCNSSKRRGAGNGTEVFFLSLKGATDQAGADLADLENAADLVGGVPPQAEDDVVSVLYEVKRNAMLERSQLLAETLLDHIAADRRVASRGIKQAGFAVLKSVEFPSVLVETAFINNPREVLLLRSPEFQSDLAKQLATGVKTYFAQAGIPLGAGAAPAGGAASGR